MALQCLAWAFSCAYGMLVTEKRGCAGVGRSLFGCVDKNFFYFFMTFFPPTM